MKLHMIENDFNLQEVHTEPLRTKDFEVKQASRWIAYGNMIVDADVKDIRVNDTPIQLLDEEKAILAYLLRQAGTVVSHSELMVHVGTQVVGSIKSYVTSLRMKLHSFEATCIIDTVRGRGYIIMNQGVNL